ncbi:hypothetical protein BDN70DRAFT_878848 [Pholiota conissans]|uniref:Fungal-type protein kinase domain-containing protein n=1 Tax=Pholiota conissans TaxID=109636 RepID=A0A9P5Z3S7_9AGAR|nr:hypothetical protein BDN70DRAFT_878848 [Pholiota conissans]
MEQETAQEVSRAVDQDYDKHCRVADTEEFMTRLLPVPVSIIKAVREVMEYRGTYSNSRWVAFPESKDNPKEDAVYEAFIKVANAIHDVALSTANRPEEDLKYFSRSAWVDCHSKTPVSLEEDGAHIRPDAFLALDPLKHHIEELEKAEQSKYPVWWLQVLAVVEMKRSNAEKKADWVALIKQIIGYLRRVLREQMDRRFVFGFTMSPSHVIVLIHDRSGVLVTERAIDIHQDPDLFIRLISAFAVLTADKLGFDPTMKLYDQNKKVAIPSYRFKTLAYPKARYDMRWLIKMNDGKEYLTTKTLSIYRAEIMRGRGTLAWAVIPCTSSSDGSVKVFENSEVYVLKQTWRPTSIQNEIHFYVHGRAASSDNIGKICLCEEAEIEGKKDDTATLIRRGLLPIPPPSPIVGEKRVRDENHEPYLYIMTTEKGIELSEKGATELPTPRVRTRNVMATYGWPLKHFSSLKELLQVLRDAIAGHKHLYMNGVLHRDISSGNIIIAQKSNPEAPDTISYGGCLIDLDRAKVGSQNNPAIAIPNARQPLETDEVLEDINPKSIAKDAKRALHRMDDAAQGFKVAGVDHIALKNVANLRIKDDVILYSSSLYPLTYSRTMDYIKEAVVHLARFGHLPDDGVCSAANLRWTEMTLLHSFESGGPKQGSMTGTPPFTSYEIMKPGSPYFPKAREDTDSSLVYHDGIHDVESFFWVLVHMCLTRAGPGGQRREEFCILPKTTTNNKVAAAVSDIDERVKQLRNVVSCLFDNVDIMADEKKRAFTMPMLSFLFERHVIANFHPYFEPLKPLVLEWFSLLRLAHEFHGYEYHSIHDRVLMLFDNALRAMNPAQNLSAAGQKELHLRQQDLEKVKSQGVLNPTDDPQNEPANRTWEPSPTQEKSTSRSQPRTPLTGMPETPTKRSKLGTSNHPLQYRPKGQ